jgi:hypothetical protein
MGFLKDITFGKSLEAFGSRIFFMKFSKSIGWCGFSSGFLDCFESASSMFCLKLLLILNLTNVVFF